jgi:tetratricopeptide (TPR) repeat protein
MLRLRSTNALVLPICLAVVGLTYCNGLSGEFVYDDKLTVVENADIRALANAPKFFSGHYWAGSGRDIAPNYRPLVLLTLAFDFAHAGLDPWYFHLTNLLIHLAAVFFAFILARRLMASTWAAAFSAALYGLHPIQSEAVNGISNRGDLLVALFALAAVFLHTKILAEGSEEGPLSRSAALGAWACFAAACLAKETGVTVLAWFMAYDWLYRAGGSVRELATWLRRRLWPQYAMYLLLFATYLWLRTDAVGSLLKKSIGFLDNPLAHQSWLQQKALAFAIAGHQGRLLAWPAELSSDYSYNALPIDSSWYSPEVMLGVALFGCCVALTFWGSRKERAVALGVLVFTSSYSITSNMLFPVDVMMAERFMTLPLFGFSLAFAAFWAKIFRHAPRWHQIAAIGVACLVLAACAGRTLVRNRDWRDTLTLVEAAAQTVPDSARVWYGIGHELWEKQNDLERAADAYERALRILPTYQEALSDSALVLSSLGRFEAAIRTARRSVELHPGDFLAWNNLGFALYKAGEFHAAIEAWEMALRVNPDFGVARNNIAELRMEMKANRLE